MAMTIFDLMVGKATVEGNKAVHVKCLHGEP